MFLGDSLTNIIFIKKLFSESYQGVEHSEFIKSCCQIKAKISEYFSYLATSLLSNIPISCFLTDYILLGCFLEVPTVYAIYSLPNFEEGKNDRIH